MIKAVNFKNWCDTNITPQAWPKVVLKSIPGLRSEDMDEAGLQDPHSEQILTSVQFDILNSALKELYGVSIELKVVSS